MTTKLRRAQQEADCRRHAMRDLEAEIRALEDECAKLKRQLSASDSALTDATAEILRLRALVPNEKLTGRGPES